MQSAGHMVFLTCGLHIRYMYLVAYTQIISTSWRGLTLKAPITDCNRRLSIIFFLCIFFFSEKIRFYISCESSAGQRIYMEHQALFSSKDKSKNKKKCRLLQFWFGAFRVKELEMDERSALGNFHYYPLSPFLNCY